MMPTIFPFPVETVLAFMLVLARVSALLAFMPIFGGSMPRQVKTGLAIMVSIVLFPTVDSSQVQEDWGVFTLAAAVASEALIGLVGAFMVSLVFAGAQMAGAVMGFQIGFGIVNVVDPATNQQVSLTAQFMNIIAILLFLILNMHHFVLLALADSFAAIPLGAMVFPSELGQVLSVTFGEIFVTGFRVAAPVTATLLLMQAAMGLIARTVPQMNVFVVGFPLTISVGLLTLGAALPTFSLFYENQFMVMIERLGLLFESMA